MPASDYTAVPSIGKLKLKGGLGPSADSKISKKKKKHKSKDPASAAGNNEESSKDGAGEDGSKIPALAKALRDEDDGLDKEARDGGIQGEGKEEWKERGKTEAERRWEEQRRKRVSLDIPTDLLIQQSQVADLLLLQLDERLKREGIKSHKERVEELNKYLSGLSEHHDMPRIGPG